jgi:protein-tyrosine phosphatase
MSFEDLQADFESHPIQGYLHSGGYIDCPLVSHIVDNLYVGGCIDGVDLGDHFTHIFSLYRWERYAYDTEKTKLYEYEMYDSESHPDLDTLDIVVPLAVEALNNGGKVLIHCQAGINRSNLTATLVLREWKGLTSAEAIDMLREKRSQHVLANKTFEKYLRSLDENVNN